MTSQRRPARPACRWAGVFAGAALAALPAAAAAQALDLFYERTVMSAADARCGLFEPGVRDALAAGRVQARGAALRAGADAGALTEAEARARRQAAALPCASPELAREAARIREAFAGFARIERMTYPGDVAEWRADRGAGRAVRWRLQQSARFGPDRMIFGLAGREGLDALLAVGEFADGRQPYAARLVLRNRDATRGPYLDTRGQALADLPLTRRLPPPSARRAYTAEARSPAGVELLPRDMKSGWAFRFPAEAAGALAGLDPREAVAVEFLFAGDQVRRAYLEVGDFAAARAFLAASR
ncbi:MAG: hypothetical protein ACK41C_00205 [Phenylobacterium sp.]|uniref:hypothetical protein n=1 Tax=Phenylobacterium sp. TaxID=1871053 RepID=UPI00391AAC7A